MCELIENSIVNLIFLIIGVVIGFFISFHFSFILRKILGFKPKYKLIDYKTDDSNTFLINVRTDKVYETITLIFLGKNKERINYRNKRFKFNYYDLTNDGKYYFIDIYKDKKYETLVEEIIPFKTGIFIDDPTKDLEDVLNS